MPCYHCADPSCTVTTVLIFYLLVFERIHNAMYLSRTSTFELLKEPMMFVLTCQAGLVELLFIFLWIFKCE